MTPRLVVHAETLPEWRWLVARGWKIVADAGGRVKGTAACDRAHRQIIVKPSALVRPSVRVRRYTIRHELAHAVHAEAFSYECAELIRVRGLDRRSAIEVVAEAACLDGTKTMTAWVRASIAWHRLHGYRYSWADVVSPQARAVATRLRAVVVNR